MQLYLPIAEMSVNMFVIFGLGWAIGFLSGVFGVGGGFLMTPMLMFLGVPPAVAVGTGANQIVASSVTGVIAHTRRGNVDFRMGIMLLVGGLVGSTAGVWLFAWLQELGHIDLAISLCYVVFLGVVGGLMFIESIQTMVRSQRKGSTRRSNAGRHMWIHGLPFKMRFRKSKLYISALLPIVVGTFVGVLTAIMGVGGGFVMVPAMIYLLGMPTQVVVGTSLFQIIFVTANTTFLQATVNQTVDIVLALILLVGAVIGAPLGARVGGNLKGEQLRVLLAILVLGMAGKLAYDLVATPDDVFTLITEVG